VQIGGGGTYAAIGGRVWLPPSALGMVVDAGDDFPDDVRAALEGFGAEMWCFRAQPGHRTTRAMNIYRGEHRECVRLCHLSGVRWTEQCSAAVLSTSRRASA
jgi:sugar/nucleoside kinase (ribokinase family)